MASEIERCGLYVRGAFHAGDGDGAPPLPGGAATRTVVLAGNAGPRMWSRFDAERRSTPMSLDEWSVRVLAAVARKLGAHAVFPFDRPWLPFQRWAMRAAPAWPSPIGILIDPVLGLWHGYRGALLFAEALALPERSAAANPCSTCAERQCLAACPVGAFGDDCYDVPACAAYLCTAPEPDCMAVGCAARRACPVGQAHRYTPAQARFHMEAFREKHRVQQ